MGLFDKILDKLGLQKEQHGTIGTNDVVQPQPPPAEAQVKAAAAKHEPTGAAPTSELGVMPEKPASIADRRQEWDKTVKQDPDEVPASPGAPRAVSQVDVMNMLEQKAKGTGLNWRQSLSDLLTLLDLDNSHEARTELAKELGASADMMNDSARMNTWLHKTVLRKIAENGGNIPEELFTSK